MINSLNTELKINSDFFPVFFTRTNLIMLSIRLCFLLFQLISFVIAVVVASPTPGGGGGGQ